ncbi:MAG: MFS transporter [Peptococcaceae bacterium]|nr:MFS transporter [Peptococcaceae bacterium]
MDNVQYPKFRWFVMAAMFVITFAQAIVLISPAPLVGVVSKMLGVSVGQATGATMGAFTIIVALIAITCGPLMDKLGIARVYIVSVAFMLVGSVLMPVIGTSFGGLVACRIIQAVGAGFTMGSIALLAAEWFPVKERSLVTGLQGASQAIGFAVGFAVIPGSFAKSGNLQGSLALAAIFVGISAIFVLIVLFGPKPPVRDAVKGGEAPVSTGLFKAALSTPVTWVAIIGGALMSWVYMAFNDLTPGYLAIEPPVGLGYGPVGAGQLMIGAQISFMIGAAASGFLVEKLFRGSARTVMMIATIASAIVVYTLKVPAVCANQSILQLILILAGFFLAIPVPVALGFIAKYYPYEITGKLGGLAMGIICLCGSTGINVNSVILHSTGFYTMSIVLISILAVISLIISLKLNPPERLGKVNQQQLPT